MSPLLALALAVATQGGAVLRLTMPAPSLHEASRDVRVYVPPSYPRAEAATRRYPVVYLLHGWPGSDGNWFGSGRAAATADTLIARNQVPELILVCPSGGGSGLLGRSFYINSYDGSSRMEDFIAGDLVRWTDSLFRTLPEPRERAIVGLSEGGTGAVNLAFKHPDVFGACGSLSGAFTFSRGMGLGRVVGPEPGRSRLLAENSPELYAPSIADRLRGLVVYFDCGTSDETLEDDRRFHAELERLGVPHTYREFPGSHTWSYWRAHLRDALIAVSSGMRGESSQAPGPPEGAGP